MLKNYLTIAIRNLLRHKLYSLINIFGLALGLACCILVILFIQREYSFDQYHENGDRIYRVWRKITDKNGIINHNDSVSGALGPALAKEFPEIETTVRMWKSWTWVLANDKIIEQEICVADPNIFDVFTYPLIKGDPETALLEPQGIVLTQSMAERFFGDTDPMGQTLTIEDLYLGGSYTVTGIMKDIPSQTSWNTWFHCVTATLPLQKGRDVWNRWDRFATWRPTRVYAHLKPNADVHALENKFPNFIQTHLGEEVQKTQTYSLQSIQRMHMYAANDVSPGWVMQRIYLYAGISAVILLIACINFMNLATARSVHRAREVGMRKVVGAQRKQLILQFLSESLLLSFLGLGLGIILAYLFIPIFQDFVGQGVQLNLSSAFAALPYFLVLTLITGLIAGSYPAFFMSSAIPISILKGDKSKQKGGHIRKGLIVVQFSVSILLLTTIYVIQQQVDFMTDRDLGFHKENVILLPLFALDRQAKTDYTKRLSFESERVKQAFLQHPDIQKAVACRYIPGITPGLFRTLRPLDRPESTYRVGVTEIDEDYMALFNIKLNAGRNINAEIASDSTAMILNTTAAKQLGWDNPIGKQVEWLEYKRTCTIIGVVDDFQNRSLRHPVAPAAYFKQPALYSRLVLKIRPNSLQNVLPFLEKTWKQFLPNRPFRYRTLDERLNDHYWDEHQFRRTTYLFCMLSIFLACLGLYGLAAFTAEQRTKEIGIRKVLGASTSNLLRLITKDFAWLVLIANIIAWPLGYLYLNDWLNGFVFRTPLSFWPFMFSGGCVLFIALLTVSFQAIKATRSNPADALRYE